MFFAGYVSECLSSTMETTVVPLNYNNQKRQVWMRIDYLKHTIADNSNYPCHTVLNEQRSRPTISPPSRPLSLFQNATICSALPLSDLLSLQLLRALARYQALQIQPQSLGHYSQHLSIKGRELTTVRGNRVRVCLSELASSITVKHQHGTPAHSLGGKEVSGDG